MSLIQLGVFVEGVAVADGGVASVHFFNGRLLTGEDLTREQTDQHRRLGRLGAAVGEGVIDGLLVSLVTEVDTGSPRLRIEPGQAINADGRVLTLHVRSDLELTIPAAASAGRGAFGDCPASKGAQPTNGVYLLVIRGGTREDGHARVSRDVYGTDACTSDQVTDGVCFVAHAVPELSSVDLSAATARSAAARVALGADGTATDAATPTAAPATGTDPRPLVTRLRARPADPLPRGDVARVALGADLSPTDAATPTAAPATDPLVTRLRARPADPLPRGDVPLALVAVTDAGVVWVDVWAVRRRSARPVATDAYAPVLASLARAEARLLQFRDHLASLTGVTSAAAHFLALPPSGALPTGLDAAAFFAASAPRAAFTVDPALIPAVVEAGLGQRAINLDDGTTPAIDVYEAAGGSERAYIRSSNGRLRIAVTLSAAPTAAQLAALAVSARSPHGDAAWTGPVVAAGAGHEALTGDLPPGTYDVTLSGEVLTRDGAVAAVAAVGGRVTATTVAGTLTQEGTVRVKVVTGSTSLFGSATVTATAVSGGSTVTATKSASDERFVLSDLPFGDWDVRASASGYHTRTERVAVADIRPIERQFSLSKTATDKPGCLTLTVVVRDTRQRTRLCMVEELAYLWKSGGASSSGWLDRVEASGRADARKKGDKSRYFRMAASRNTSETTNAYVRMMKGSSVSYIEKADPRAEAFLEIKDVRAWGRVPLDDGPDPSGFTTCPVPTDLASDVRAWLLAWRAWLIEQPWADRSLVAGLVRDTTPGLLIPARSTISDLVSATKRPDDFQMLATFGPLYVPVNVVPVSLFHPKDVHPRRADLFPGYDDRIFAFVEKFGVGSLSEAASIPVQLLAFVLPVPIEEVEAASAEWTAVGGEAKEKLLYLGMTRDDYAKLDEDLRDPVVLANAPTAELVGALGNLGARIHGVARSSVPRESWAADTVASNLPATIASLGDLSRMVAADATVAGTMLGLDAAGVERISGITTGRLSESLATSAVDTALGGRASSVEVSATSASITEVAVTEVAVAEIAVTEIAPARSIGFERDVGARVSTLLSRITRRGP